MTSPQSLVREARALYGARPVRAGIPATLPDDVLRHVARGSRAAEFTRSGRHAAAERLLRDVAGAFVRRQALGPAAQALVSLGRLFLERGRPVDADQAFAEAAVHAQSVKDEALSLSAQDLAGGGTHRCRSVDCRRIALSSGASHRGPRR